MSGRRRAFRLWKYYLDVVGENGDVGIGYVAGLRWGPLALRYAALLESAADGTSRERQTWARVPEPAVGSYGIDWRCEPLGLTGSWTEPVGAHEALLLDDGRGTVRWQVLAARAAVRLERTGQPTLAGWGYAERLELNIEPWRLPIDTLFWGRFHAATDTLVWIGWEGDAPLRHVLHNGELLADATFGKRALRFEPGRELALLETRTLRAAPVVAAMSRLPQVLQRVPPSFLTAREEKWLSLARLSSPHRPPVTGWALHERVRWR